MLSKTAITNLLGLASLVIAANKGPISDASIIAHTGNSFGEEVSFNGLTQYVSKPKGGKSRGKPTVGVLYLTDVYGIQLPQNRLLADSFARAGFVSVAPDLFNGSPAPADIELGSPDVPEFNATQFIEQHNASYIDPIIANSIDYLRNELGVTKIAATGYCFGGRYSFRVLAEGKGVDVAFAAHPSLVTDDEIKAITGPASVAAAENDSLMPPGRRAEVESLLGQSGQPFSLTLYGGTSHGFGVRANISDPRQKFGKEEAFLQAVRFFNNWAKTETDSIVI